MIFEKLNSVDHWREDNLATLIRGILIIIAILVDIPIVPVIVRMVIGIPAKTMILIFGICQISDAVKEHKHQR